MSNFTITDEKTGRVVFAEKKSDMIERIGGLDEEIPERKKSGALEYINFVHTRESER